MNITRAISLYAPWAWAILHLGKDVENRTAGFPGHQGWVWLHASKTLSRGQMFEEAECVAAMAECGGRPLSQAQRTELWTEMFQMKGHIVGAVEITGRVTSSDSPWFVGPIGLTLGERFALVKPVPARGALGLWKAPSVRSEQ